MDSPDEKVVDKIRRLLRLAESSNVNEAATAAARAQELMTRHRIEVAAIEPESSVDEVAEHIDDPLEESARVVVWKETIAKAVALANGCDVYLRRGRTVKVIVVGRSDDAALVRGLYAALVRSVDDLATRCGRGLGRGWCNAFRRGAADAVAIRLREAARLAKKQARDASATGAALVRLDARDALTKAAMDELGLKAGRGASVPSDHDGYVEGRKAGRSIPLESRGALAEGGS